MGGQGGERQCHRARLHRHQQLAALQADETRNRQIMERIPEGRWGSPADMGGAAVFLASNAADYIQGHVLAVDGGWLAR
jgi:2-deoxy-D-gluconate 3-dehydrogenase